MLNIQEAIQSGKPFRRRGWVEDDIYVVYIQNDIALTLATDPSTAIELDVQDILADDWYLRDETIPEGAADRITGGLASGIVYRV